MTTQEQQPTNADIMRAGVWPTIAALVVTAIIMIERMQVDGSASCSLQSASNPDACGDQFFSKLAPLMPAAFAFGLAHIIGAASLYANTTSRFSRAERAAKFFAYGALHLWPAFGWYLFYAGLAGGFLVSITVIGLIVAIPVGVLTAGFASGLVLALAAGPSLVAPEGSRWRRLLGHYGASAAAGAFLLWVGAFFVGIPVTGSKAVGPWFPALGSLAMTALACCLTWFAAVRAASPTPSTLWRPQYRTALARIAAVSLALAFASDVMVRNALTVFPQSGGLLAPVAAYLRDYRPPYSSGISLAGLRFVGARERVLSREMTSRSRMVTTTLDKGTPDERNVGSTVFDDYVNWRIEPSGSDKSEAIEIVADGGGVKRDLYCKATTDGRSCTSEPDLPVAADVKEQTVTLALDIDEEFEFLESVPNAALGSRWDNRTRGENTDRKTWKKLYCRLHLVNVTTAALSVHQVIPCNADWVAEEKRVRADVEGMFSQ